MCHVPYVKLQAEQIHLYDSGSIPETEVWTPVVLPGGETSSKYLISSHGRILRIAGGRGAVSGRVLRTPVTQDGYPTVCLYSGKKRCTYNVHTLVAWAFLYYPYWQEGDTRVHHKNGRRNDNRVRNLECMPLEKHKTIHENDP